MLHIRFTLQLQQILDVPVAEITSTVVYVPAKIMRTLKKVAEFIKSCMPLKFYVNEKNLCDSNLESKTPMCFLKFTWCTKVYISIVEA